MRFECSSKGKCVSYRHDSVRGRIWQALFKLKSTSTRIRLNKKKIYLSKKSTFSGNRLYQDIRPYRPYRLVSKTLFDPGKFFIDLMTELSSYSTNIDLIAILSWKFDQYRLDCNTFFVFDQASFGKSRGEYQSTFAITCNLRIERKNRYADVTTSLCLQLV